MGNTDIITGDYTDESEGTLFLEVRAAIDKKGKIYFSGKTKHGVAIKAGSPIHMYPQSDANDNQIFPDIDQILANPNATLLKGNPPDFRLVFYNPNYKPKGTRARGSYSPPANRIEISGLWIRRSLQDNSKIFYGGIIQQGTLISQKCEIFVRTREGNNGKQIWANPPPTGETGLDPDKPRVPDLRVFFLSGRKNF